MQFPKVVNQFLLYGFQKLGNKICYGKGCKVGECELLCGIRQGLEGRRYNIGYGIYSRLRQYGHKKGIKIRVSNPDPDTLYVWIKHFVKNC